MPLRTQWIAKRLGYLLLAASATGTVSAAAQTIPVNPELPGWLRYPIPPDPPRYHDMPHAVVLLAPAGQEAPVELAAADELDRGLGHMVAGTDLLLHRFDPRLDSIVLGTTDELHRAKVLRTIPGWAEKPLPPEGFRIVHLRRGVRQWWILQGGSPKAELYAAFRFSALVAEDQQLPNELTESPRTALRAVQWNGPAADLLPLVQKRPVDTTAGGFSRLFASVGINSIILSGSVEDARHVATAVLPYGMRVWLRPEGIDTSDARQVEDLAASIPNFGGLVVSLQGKVSPGELQPLNLLARLLQRHGASLLLQDALGAPLRSVAADAHDTPEQRASVLRGALEPNVIVTGPAVSPLIPLAGLGSANFGLLPGVAQAAAFHLLPPPKEVIFPLAAWQRALTTPERGLHNDTTLLGTLQAEPPHGVGAGGVIATVDAADANRLMHQPLLLANLYAFGRMAWSPDESADKIADEWARQTWGDDARVFGVAKHIVLSSLEAFVGAGSPLGMPDLSGPNGGPDPSRAARRNGVAGVPLADAKAVGVDRTASGTDEIARYPAGFAAMLTDTERCPDDWLLALHRLPYSHKLQNGKTVAQTFYDAHFAGAAKAANAEDAWEQTQPLLDAGNYGVVHRLLEQSTRRAEIWRESTTEWLARVSGVPDELGYVGTHTGRVEAEAMTLKGYATANTAEREDASAGAIATCTSAECSASTVFHGEENAYRIEMGYFDDAGSSSFELRVNGVARAHWNSAALTDGGTIGGQTAERFVANGIRLKPQDTVQIIATPRNGGHAPLDFIEITRDPRWN